MRIPSHPFWLLLLTTALTLSSGHRNLDFVFADQAVNDVDYGGALIASLALTPFFLVPIIGFITIAACLRYPPSPISLFWVSRHEISGQICFTILFGLFATISLDRAWVFFTMIGGLAKLGYEDITLPMSCHVIASLGSAYQFLTFRAITCHYITSPRRQKAPPAQQIAPLSP